MNTTRTTLLSRLKTRSDAAAWREFHRIYAPLLYRYARGRGLSRADAEEVRDQCLEIVARKIPTFEYDKKKGRFKGWLRRIAQRRVVDLFRKRRELVAGSGVIRAAIDPGPTGDEVWDRQWELEHLRFCVERIRGSVSETSYRAFHMLLFDECSVEEVCARLGLNTNQVYKIKSRVLQRVRQELREFEDDE